jgi:hypothetical protein
MSPSKSGSRINSAILSVFSLSHFEFEAMTSEVCVWKFVTKVVLAKPTAERNAFLFTNQISFQEKFKKGKEFCIWIHNTSR